MIRVDKGRVSASGDLAQVLTEFSMLAVSLAYELDQEVGEFLEEVKEKIAGSGYSFTDLNEDLGSERISS